MLREAFGVLLFAAALQSPEAPVPAQPPPSGEPRLLTIGEALRSGLARNPDLLNAADVWSTASLNARAALAGYLPQVTPFYTSDKEGRTGARTDLFGVSLLEQLPFGPRVEGNLTLSKTPLDGSETSYGADTSILLRQPLLRGLDPAVAREPLRQARRNAETQARALEASRRRTIVVVYRAYLGAAEAESALLLARERVERAHTLTQFSRARFEAGSVSRLDVLRAEQQEAAAGVSLNGAESALEDARDALRRAAGLAADAAFRVESVAALPQEPAALEELLASAGERRPEALEARSAVGDAEAALRIARSQQLPSLEAVLGYEGIGFGSSYGNAFRSGASGFTFGFSSQVGLNLGVAIAQRKAAEIALEGKRRAQRLLDDDLAREVRQAWRRLEAVKRDHAIAAQNLEVADLQLKVAQLRFEKGLSDNFNVVDAENLLNAARLFELDSRFRILLAELDTLYAAGVLEERRYVSLP